MGRWRDRELSRIIPSPSRLLITHLSLPHDYCASNLQSHGSILIPSDRADRTTRLPISDARLLLPAAASMHTRIYKAGRWDFLLDLFSFDRRAKSPVSVLYGRALLRVTLMALWPRMPQPRGCCCCFCGGSFLLGIGLFFSPDQRIVFNFKIISDCPGVVNFLLRNDGFLASERLYVGRRKNKYFSSAFSNGMGIEFLCAASMYTIKFILSTS